MKTTLDIDNQLFKRAKQMALKDDVTLKEIVERGLRRYLDTPQTGPSKFKLKLTTFKGDGLKNNIDPSN